MWFCTFIRHGKPFTALIHEFSFSSGLSLCYSEDSSSDGSRQLLMFRVLVGETTRGYSNMRKPPINRSDWVGRKFSFNRAGWIVKTILAELLVKLSTSGRAGLGENFSSVDHGLGWEITSLQQTTGQAEFEKPIHAELGGKLPTSGRAGLGGNFSSADQAWLGENLPSTCHAGLGENFPLIGYTGLRENIPCIGYADLGGSILLKSFFDGSCWAGRKYSLHRSFFLVSQCKIFE